MSQSQSKWFPADRSRIRHDWIDPLLGLAITRPVAAWGWASAPWWRRAPSAAGANVGVDLQQRTHRRFGAGARHAAFGGDAERRRVAARRRDARVLVMQEDRKLRSNGLALRPHRLLKEMILHVLGQIAPDPNY